MISVPGNFAPTTQDFLITDLAARRERMRCLRFGLMMCRSACAMTSRSVARSLKKEWGPIPHCHYMGVRIWYLARETVMRALCLLAKLRGGEKMHCAGRSWDSRGNYWI